MFDISFSELVVIAVVALIVIGPERLPKVARTAGHLWGRAQRYVSGVKADIARDMAVEETRKYHERVQQEAATLERSMQQTGAQLDQQFEALSQPASPPVPPAATQHEPPVQSER